MNGDFIAKNSKQCLLVYKKFWRRPGKHTKTLISPSLFFSIRSFVLWYWVVRSHRLFSFACTEEKGERYLRVVAVVKPARGTAIRFPDSATAQPFEADRLRSVLPRVRSALHHFFMRTERSSVSVMDFLHEFDSARFTRLFSDLKYVAVASFCTIFLKLKSNIFKCIFPIFFKCETINFSVKLE